MTETATDRPSIKERQLELDREKLALEREKFELEKRKSLGLLQAINQNIGLVITAMIGIATITVSYLQLEITKSTNENQLQLEKNKNDNDKSKDDRNFQFDVAKLLLERQSQVSTSDLEQIKYLRDIVMATLPVDLSIKITGKMADNASDDRIRAAWQDAHISGLLSVGSQSTGIEQKSISVEFVASTFPKAPRSRIEDILTALKDVRIEDPNEVVALLSYIFATTGTALQETSENLNYTNPSRLLEIFPGSFHDLTDASRFAGKPQEIANRVYGNRMGNTQPDDGWRYRGRGYLLTAGRTNYEISSQIVGIDLINDPDRLVDSKIAAKEAAGRFFKLRNRSLRNVVLTFNGPGFFGLAQAQGIFQQLVPNSPKLLQDR